MEAWWGDLGSSLQIFYGIAIVTSMLMAVQLAMMMLGFDGDSDMDGDMGDGESHAVGSQVLSIRTITAFFTGFGWTGVSAIKGGLALPLSVILATAVGSVFMAGVFFLMRALSGLRYSGTLDYRNAIGVVGTVYLPIPAKMSGPGKIEVLVQGRLTIVSAFSHVSEILPNRSRVTVVEVIGQDALVVEPLSTAVEATDKEVT